MIRTLYKATRGKAIGKPPDKMYILRQTCKQADPG